MAKWTLPFSSRVLRVSRDACISPALLFFAEVGDHALSKNRASDLNSVMFVFFLIVVVSSSELGAKVTKVMEEFTLLKRDRAVKDMPFSVMNKICVKVNILRPFFDDFRMVAEKLGTDRVIIEWIGQ